MNKRTIVVIKIGSMIIKSDIMQSLASQIAWLYRQGMAPVIVSSGAVFCGGGSSDNTLGQQKVAAMVGQPILTNKWQEAFSQHNLVTGQMLGSRYDFKHNEAIETLHLAIAEGIIPIINENDPVATEELVAMREHGDNDILAAIVAVSISASQFIILTDVDGLYSGGSPKRNDQAKPISVVSEVTDEILSLVEHSKSDQNSGMTCKLAAIKKATIHGIVCQLANGNRPNVIPDLFGKNPPGTLFEAQCS